MSPRTRKNLKRALWAVVGLVVLVLILFLGVLAYLSSEAGGARMRDLALQKTNETISGKLEAGRVSYGGNVLVLEDVVLRDPEGNVVAEIARLEARISLLNLLARRIELNLLALKRPRFYLRQDDRGLNLARALKAKAESELPEEDEKSASKFGFSIDKATIEEGYVDFLLDGEERDLRVTADAVSSEGHFTLSRLADLKAGLRLEGKLLHPLEGPIAFNLEAKGDEKVKAGGVEATVAGLKLDATGAMSGTQSGKIDLEGLTLDPATARAFYPEYPLIAPLTGSGSASIEAGVAKTNLTLKAASAELKVDGAIHTETLVSPGLTVTGRGINLAELVEDMPPSELALNLRAEGGGKDLETAVGHVELDVPQSRLKGQTVGPIRFKASADRGTFQVSELLARLPGVELTGGGKGTMQAADFTAHLEAKDLSQLSKTFAALNSQAAPQLSGAGALDVRAFGPVKSLGITARGAFAHLRYGTNRARNLTLDARVPDVTRPLESQLDLKAARVELGERVFREASVALVTENRNLAADVRASGFADLSLHVAGTLDEDRQGILLRELAFTYPEAQWALQAPAQLRFEPDRLSTEKLTLAAGQQTISVEGTKTGDRVDADVEVAALDLSTLPRAFMDPQLNLGGLVNVDLRANGRLPRPELHAKVRLQNGRVREYSDLSLELDGDYVRDRATGKLVASSPIASLNLEFDTPVQGLMRRRPEPLRIVLDMPEVDLANAMRVAGQKKDVEGRASAHVEINGRADDPRILATVVGRGLRMEQMPPKPIEAPAFDLKLESAADGKLSMRLDARVDVASSKGFVAVYTPWTLGGLIRKPPDKEDVLETPLVVEAHLQDYPLNQLPIGTRLDGTLTVEADFKGPPLAPVGDARILGKGIAAASVPPTDVQFDFDAKDDGLQAKLTARRPSGELANLVASFAAPIGKLQDPKSLTTVALKVDGTVGPVAMAELVAPTRSDDEQAAKKMQGLFRSEIHIDGNLEDPRAEVRAWLEQFGVGAQCLGKAKLALDYADAKAKLDVLMASAGGGVLSLQGFGDIDLSYAATKGGLKYENAPLRAKLTADKFDLAFLSGVTPTVRQLAGQLRADGEFNGTMATPDGRLTMEWVEGRMALEGYGEYRNIHVALDGNRDRILLTDLSMEGAGGKMSMNAELNRTGKRFDLTASANAEKFPLIVDDQLMAFVSMRADAEGTASDERIHVRQLRIPEAHVFLPEKDSKDLQDLDRPNDVILVKNGKPLQKRKEKKVEPGEADEVGVGGANGAVTAKADQEHDADPESPPREYWVTINAPRNLWVHGPDLNLELGLSEGFRYEKAVNSNMYGEVRILRGRADALGRRFDVERGSVLRFTGPLKQPFINVTATHVNEREGVKVKLSARGQGKDVKLSAQSDPPLAESEIYTLLATGRRTLKAGAGGTASGSAQVASIAGSLVAAQMKTAIQNVLPINFDVLSIEAGSEGLEGTRIEAGTYITDRWYVGFAGKVGADPMRKENRAEIRTEYQITPRWNFEGFCGDARTCGADILWHKDY